MSEKKYIFFDIDGTILTGEGRVLSSTKKALRQAQENGHKIFINTGRCRNIVPKQLVDLNFDGMVCATGSYAEYHQKVLFQESFTKEQVNKVLKISKENNLPVIFSSATECVVSSKDIGYYVELFSHGKIKASEFKGLYNINDPFLESIEPLMIDDDIDNYYDNHPKISDFIYIHAPFGVDKFNELLGDDLNVDKASFKEPDDFSGEITLSKCTKSTGIKRLLDILGADMKDSIAVGDGFNDIEMLKAAHLSIAMGNSPQEIKDIADYVTDDIFEDGVYNALKHFKLI